MKPRIAVFAGPTATILSSAPLITSNKARADYGLTAEPESGARGDALRPQRIAAPVTVYVEQFSAHPLERDASHLYAPPDGYMHNGSFHETQRSPSDVPVYRVTLEPTDGLYLLPYHGRQVTGDAWDGACAGASADVASCRQSFYPDAARLFEEIDRFGVDEGGRSDMLSSRADFDFYRAAPSGGYTKGAHAADRTDVGNDDIGSEAIGDDFFPYLPVRREPRRRELARLTNVVSAAMSEQEYAGALWLEGSPNAEETCYWLNLLLDITNPLVATTAPDWAHGVLGASGDRNVVDAVDYILSGVWKDDTGRDSIGPTVIHDKQILTARDAQKGEARAGGFSSASGYGGAIGTVGHPGPPVILFTPTRRSTYRSEVNLSKLPDRVQGVQGERGRIRAVSVETRTSDGRLVASAIPSVSIVKGARFHGGSSGDGDDELGIDALVESNLRHGLLGGLVAEGAASYGTMPDTVDTALRRAVFSGTPVVKVGRGNATSVIHPLTVGVSIAGSNLTATKARLLLMACLMRFGALPFAADPDQPTEAEVSATRNAIAEYQGVFDSH